MFDQVGNNPVISLVRNNKIKIFDGEVAIFECPFERNTHKVTGMHKNVTSVRHLKTAFTRA